MAKLEESELLKFQLTLKDIEIAVMKRDALNAALLAKYGEPGETALSITPDGTIVRAAKLEAVPEEKGA